MTSPAYRRLVPGHRLVARLPDPLDPRFTAREAEVTLARAVSNLWHPCPLCGAETPFVEFVELDRPAAADVAHAAGCPAGDRAFQLEVLGAYLMRHGEMPRKIVIVCEVLPDFTLDPIEVAAA